MTSDTVAGGQDSTRPEGESTTTGHKGIVPSEGLLLARSAAANQGPPSANSSERGSVLSGSSLSS